MIFHHLTGDVVVVVSAAADFHDDYDDNEDATNAAALAWEFSIMLTLLRHTQTTRAVVIRAMGMGGFANAAPSVQLYCVTESVFYASGFHKCALWFVHDPQDRKFMFYSSLFL